MNSLVWNLTFRNVDKTGIVKLVDCFNSVFAKRFLQSHGWSSRAHLQHRLCKSI